MQSRVPIAKYKDVRASKQMAKMIISAKRKVLDETNLQIDILFNAAAIVLYRYHGWKDDQIMTFFKAAEEVGQDCSEDYEISLIEMLWNETGIELMAEGCEKRWFQVSFLNSEMDIDRLAIDQYSMLQFYRQQLPWVPAQITAAILLSLYRVEG